MKPSMTWQKLLAHGLRMLTVVAMAGFVAWLPSSRTTTTPAATIENVLISWGGGAE